jgi:hypothetical protein
MVMNFFSKFFGQSILFTFFDKKIITFNLGRLHNQAHTSPFYKSFPILNVIHTDLIKKGNSEGAMGSKSQKKKYSRSRSTFYEVFVYFKKGKRSRYKK